MESEQYEKRSRRLSGLVKIFDLSTGHWSVPSLSSAPLPMKMDHDDDEKVREYIASGRMYKEVVQATAKRRARDAGAAHSRAALDTNKTSHNPDVSVSADSLRPSGVRDLGTKVLDIVIRVMHRG